VRVGVQRTIEKIRHLLSCQLSYYSSTSFVRSSPFLRSLGSQSSLEHRMMVPTEGTLTLKLAKGFRVRLSEYGRKMTYLFLGIHVIYITYGGLSLLDQVKGLDRVYG